MAAQAFYSERRETVVRAKGRVATDDSLRQTRAPSGSAGATGRVNFEPSARLAQQPILASDLYVDLDALSPALARGMILLGQALICISEASQAARQQDPMTADLYIQTLRPTLRRLFMCREIGDGFAALIDALISAFENNHGLPLDSSHLSAVQAALLKLRDQPFLAFSAAARAIEDLERAGFSTEPPGFEHFADWLTA